MSPLFICLFHIKIRTSTTPVLLTLLYRILFYSILG